MNRVRRQLTPVQQQLLFQSLDWLIGAIRAAPVFERTAEEQDTLLLAAVIRHRLRDDDTTEPAV